MIAEHIVIAFLCALTTGITVAAGCMIHRLIDKLMARNWYDYQVGKAVEAEIKEGKGQQLVESHEDMMDTRFENPAAHIGAL